jgi:hypothetical protein
VNVWHIEVGAIEQTDVSGLTLVELSRLHGHVSTGRTVVFYVDERATNEQRDALLAAWTGKLGGPIADLAQLIGEVAGVERAPIAFTSDGGRGSLQVGQVVNARFVPAPSNPGRPSHAHAAVSHGEEGPAARDGDICTTIVGSQTAVGEAATYRVAAPAYGFAIDLHDHKVIQGRFQFDS